MPTASRICASDLAERVALGPVPDRLAAAEAEDDHEHPADGRDQADRGDESERGDREPPQDPAALRGLRAPDVVFVRLPVRGRGIEAAVGVARHLVRAAAHESAFQADGAGGRSGGAGGWTGRAGDLADRPGADAVLLELLDEEGVLIAARRP